MLEFYKERLGGPLLLNMGVDDDFEQPPLFLIHPGGGQIDCYHEAALLVESRRVYGISFPYDEVSRDWPDPSFDMAWLADLYTKKILSVKEGPCIIGGWSAGGSIAHAVARRLGALGHVVPPVVMIDSACPNVYRDQKDKVAQVNRQALLFYIDKLNNFFDEIIRLDDLEQRPGFDINLFLPDLMCFIYKQLRIQDIVKKDSSKAAVDSFHYTIEGIVRAVLNTQVDGKVDRMLFIKAEKSDMSSASAWRDYCQGEMQLHEIEDASHLSIVEGDNIGQVASFIESYAAIMSAPSSGPAP